jgi:hypothetical protein
MVTWEYKEVVFPLLPGKRFGAGEFETERLKALKMTYNYMLLDVLAREGKQGWEPDCNTDFDKMEASGAILVLRHGGILFSPSHSYEEVRLRMRRQVNNAANTGKVTISAPENAAASNWQDYNLKLADILLEMGTETELLSMRKLLRPHVQKVFEPAFFPAFFQVISMLRHDGNSMAIDRIAIAATIELREFVASLDVSRMTASAIAANLILAPNIEGLGTEGKSEKEKMILGLAKTIVTLYPRIKQIQDELKTHFIKIITETELRTQVNDVDSSQEMRDQSESLNKTMLLVEQVITFMGVMDSHGTDQKVVSKAAMMDLKQLIAVSTVLIHVFQIMNLFEQKDKVTVALTQIMSAQKK